jgi:hypothetical protein
MSCYVLHGTFHGKQSQSFQKFAGMTGATPSLPTVHYDTNHNDSVKKARGLKQEHLNDIMTSFSYFNINGEDRK